ncbi:MAG TPA: polysaccharide pyruvyl transferase family protein [Candidatus Babeliaceae bacterium]|nr:polysaccharide pyruvyl transferase family protein [Candidatus Babeliaceae bacterium]
MNAPLFIQRIINKNRPPLKTFWWRYRYPHKLNFGDELTPYILKSLWGIKCEWVKIDKCDFAATGSIIEILQWESNGKPIKVWGSGFIKPGPRYADKNLDFYAVRGPKSLSRIVQRRDVALGDPGLLCNRVFKRSKQVKYKVGVVFHYTDQEARELDAIRDNPEYLLINPLNTPQQVIADITSCEIIFSSSLHGLIVADSFGVPNFWMPFSELLGGEYKFNDYYMATDRSLVKRLPSILGDESEIEAAVGQYEPISNLKEIQKNLIKSFPYNISLGN